VIAKSDRAGQKYFEVGNIRITCIPTTWNGGPGLRIQVKRLGRLLRGPEIPIADKTNAYELVKAFLCSLEELGF
jgi:hypothetical protein